MTRLRSCEACSRHVFVTETRCPFCQAVLEPSSSAPIYNIKAGMSRAQRFTLVAAVASQALIGCSDDPKGPGSQGTGGTTQGTGGKAQGSGGTAVGSGGATPIAGKGGGAMPVYGAPFDPDGSGGRGNSGQAGTGGKGVGGAQAVYGAPPPQDAGIDTPDASDVPPKRDGGGIQPVYGAPVYGAPVYGAAIPPDKDK